MSNRWAVLALLFLVRTCMGLQFQSVPAVAPLYLDGFLLTATDIGLIIGLYHAPGIALALPGGTLARFFSDKWIVASGLALMLGGALVMGMGGRWPTQLAGRLVSGTGAVLLNVYMSKMVQDWFAGQEMATAMGIFVNSWPFGIAIGLLIFPLIAAQGGLVLVQISVAIIIIIALTALIVLYSAPASSHPASSVSPSNVWPTAWVCLTVISAGLVWGLYNAALGVVFGFGPLMLTEREWTLSAASSATSIVLWFAVASIPFGGAIADGTGRHAGVIITSLAIFAMALIVAAKTEYIVASFAVLGLIGGLAAGPIMSLPTRVLKPETRAAGMGLFFTVFYVLQALGPWIAGRATAASETSATAFLTGALFLGAAAILLAVFLSLASPTKAPRAR